MEIQPEQFYKIIGSTNKQVRYIMYNKPAFYHTFEIPKKNGTRTICAPKKRLKEIQANILNNILYNYKVHKNAFGFVPTQSIIKNARKHVKSELVLKLDIRNFFGTITSNRVQGLYDKLDIIKDISYQLTELCTFNNCLPQGAPTSPYLSNLICFKLDKRFTGLAKQHNLEYSRYADDITLSGKKISKKVVNNAEKIIREEGFFVARDKTQFLSKANRQAVTGIIVNEKLSLGRKKYHQLKSIIYNCGKKGISSQNIENHRNFKKHLLGKISILKNLDIWKWFELKSAINKLDWETYDPVKFSHKSDENKVRTDILDSITALNQITNKSFSSDMDIFLLKHLYKGVNSEEEFNHRIQIINSFFDNIRLEFFLKLLSKEDKERNSPLKSIRTIELVLLKKGKSPEVVCETLRDIQILSAGITRHTGTNLNKQVFKVYDKYLVDITSINYKELFEKILIQLRNSLEKLLFSLK